MGGIEELMAESNERWTKATKRAQGLADKGLGAALKAYYTRFWLVGVIVLISIGSVVTALAVGESVGEWPSYLSFGFMLAGLGTLIGGLIYNSKRIVPAAEYGNIDVTLSLTNEERKHIRRQVAGKAAIIPEHLPVARGAAVQIRKSLATQLLIVPFYPLVFIPQVVDGTGWIGPLDWIFVGLIVLLLVGVSFLVRDFRRSGRFLAHTAY